MSKESVSRRIDSLQAEVLRHSNEVVRLAGEIELEARKLAVSVLDSDTFKSSNGGEGILVLAQEMREAEVKWENRKMDILALESIDF